MPQFSRTLQQGNKLFWAEENEWVTWSDVEQGNQIKLQVNFYIPCKTTITLLINQSIEYGIRYYTIYSDISE